MGVFNLFNQRKKISRLSPSPAVREMAERNKEKELKAVQAQPVEPVKEASPVVVAEAAVPVVEEVTPPVVVEVSTPVVEEPVQETSEELLADPEFEKLVEESQATKLLSMSIASFKVEIESGDHDSILQEILDQESNGKNRKNFRAKVEERLQGLAS